MTHGSRTYEMRHYRIANQSSKYVVRPGHLCFCFSVCPCVYAMLVIVSRYLARFLVVVVVVGGLTATDR